MADEGELPPDADADDRAQRRDEDEADDDERQSERQKPQPLAYRGPAPGDKEAGGFFTIYKSGQGYWTRLGTAVGAAVVLLFCGWFTWQQMNFWEIGYKSGRPNHGLIWGVITGIEIVGALIAWRLMNKPSNVDFLIATDSEMKKVNWTSRRELIGSTKVVIAFMFIIAAFLFIMDVMFGYLFYFINVLKTPPF